MLHNILITSAGKRVALTRYLKSTNLHYIKTADDLTQEILDDPKLIFMEYIDKKVYKEYMVDMYFGKDNKVKCIVPRERIELVFGNSCLSYFINTLYSFNI